MKSNRGRSAGKIKYLPGMIHVRVGQVRNLKNVASTNLNGPNKP
jgi:hypothetical protein